MLICRLFSSFLFVYLFLDPFQEKSYFNSVKMESTPNKSSGWWWRSDSMSGNYSRSKSSPNSSSPCSYITEHSCLEYISKIYWIVCVCLDNIYVPWIPTGLVLITETYFKKEEPILSLSLRSIFFRTRGIPSSIIRLIGLFLITYQANLRRKKYIYRWLYALKNYWIALNFD